MHLCIDANAISAWAALVAAITAIIALLCESRRSKFQVGVEILMKMEDTFDSERMRKARNRAAQGIKRRCYEDVDDVLNFFETIALLVRRKAVDPKFVWHSFFDWIHPYYLLCRDHLGLNRKEDPTYWEELIWLEDLITKIECKQSRCSEHDLDVMSEEELARFLEDELQA